jgi:hypothetical protein
VPGALPPARIASVARPSGAHERRQTFRCLADPFLISVTWPAALTVNL